ncbi:MAG: serine/threonine protein kinase [Deltaproteobacteria bacterium]|nr:serine/threonine protein kinase [Deltaproteobacteria bacterium]
MSKYRLIGELGRGGMADVYLALAAGPGGFNKLLVIKQLRTIENAQFLTMFLDEARLAARLSHPNVVQTFEVVHEEERAFIVMEFLDGPSLSRLRRVTRATGEQPMLPIELHVLSQALAGLHCAHELANYDGTPLGVVHRDFTPQNLLVTYDGDVKIVDFGVAKANFSAQTVAGVFKGKLSYAPPEQVLGHPVDRRTDVFAAGVILWEALTGQSPWHGMEAGVVIHALASGDIPRLTSDAGVDPTLVEICNRAMEAEPTARFASALEMRDALEQYIQLKQLTVTRRQLGEHVSRLLAEQHAKTRAIIDGQIRQVKDLPSADSLMVAPLDTLTPSPISVLAGRQLPSLAAPYSSPGAEAKESIPAVAPLEPAPELAPAFARPKPVDGTLRLVVLLGFGALLAVLVILVALLWQLRSENRASSPAATVATPPMAAPVIPPAQPAPPVPAQVEPAPMARIEPAAPAALSEPPTVAVRIRVLPAHARVYLDGIELPSNPFDGVLPRDAKLHELRVGAPGYLGLRRGFQLDRDLSLELALERQLPAPKAEVAPAKPSAAPAKPPPAGASTEDPEYFTPKKGPSDNRPRRQLDTDIRWNE